MTDHDDEQSLQDSLRECLKFVSKMDSGVANIKDIQEELATTIGSLQQLTISVNALGLFSSNEQWEELPTGSLSCMLIPCYLAVLHVNKMQLDPVEKMEELKMAKVYFRDFLRRLREYGLIEIELPWDADKDEEEVETASRKVPDETELRLLGEKKRMEKINRFRNLKEQEELVAALNRQRELNPEDDGAQRDMIVAQLRYWSFRALSDLESIDNEIPMLEYMAKVRGGLEEMPKPKARGPSRKPFIITRDKAQKAVFGLGYPSIPVMTVDEWYNERVAKGAFGPGGPGGSGVSAPAESRLSDSENEDDGRDDERRAAKQRWDEYKDSHRRGWGNMHNKG